MAGVFVSFELSSNQPRRGCISRSTVVIHLASTVPQDLMSGSTDLCNEARYLHKYSPQWSHRLFRSTNRNPFQPNFPALRLLRNVGAVGRGFQDSDSRICCEPVMFRNILSETSDIKVAYVLQKFQMKRMPHLGAWDTRFGVMVACWGVATPVTSQ